MRALVPLFVACILLWPLTDTDVWWHLASARAMLEKGAFLYSDPFPFVHPSLGSAASTPWANVHWVFQLFLFSVYKVTGPAGIVAFRCLGWAAVIALFRRALTPKRPWALDLLLWTLALYPIRYQLPERPIILTLLTLGFMLLLLERWRKNLADSNHGLRQLWPLIPLQILLANIQGISALGPFLLGAYLLGARLDGHSKGKGQITAILLAPSLLYLTGLLNPYGWRTLLIPFRHLFRLAGGEGEAYRLRITENLPPWHLPFPHDLSLPVTIGCTLVGLWAVTRPSASRIHLLVFSGCVALAWLAVRNLPLLVLVSVPLVVHAISGLQNEARQQISQHPRSPIRWLHGLAAPATLALCATLVTISLASTRGASLIEPAPFRQPSEEILASLADLASGHSSGIRVLAALEHGGYLHWQLWPQVRSYGDGRLILRPASWFRDYLSAWQGGEGFRSLDSAAHFDAVLTPSSLFHDYYPLCASLARDPRWLLVDGDASGLLWVRRGPTQELGAPLESLTEAELTARASARAPKGLVSEALLLLQSSLSSCRGTPER